MSATWQNGISEGLGLDEEMERVMARASIMRAGVNRYGMPFAQSRAQLLREREWWIDGAPKMAAVIDDACTVSGRIVRVRHNLPLDSDPTTQIVYLHGGGWCVGSIDTHDGVMRDLAQACRAPCIGIDYSLAPENPYPAALDDVHEIFARLRAEHPRETRWILAGDSAGANLALLETMRARDAGQPLAHALLLFYGAYLPVRPSASMLAFGDGSYGLSREAMLRYEDAYFVGQPAANVPQAFPLQRALNDLPPALISAAALDPLLDDSLSLYDALSAQGTNAELRVYPGVIHGFLSYSRMLSAARLAFAEAATFLAALSVGNDAPQE